jgi:hypothetical protein
MPSKVMVQARLCRLMVATQQVREKYDMKALNKGGLLGAGFDSQQAVVITIPKTSRYLGTTPMPQNKTSITPQSPLQWIDLVNRTNQTWFYQPYLGSTNHVRVHATYDREHNCYNSFTLCRGCTHSPWVAIIHDSRIPVIQVSTLTHFRGVC